jgi:hypothetical protein
MRNYKSNISFEDCAKFDHVLYYRLEGVLLFQFQDLPIYYCFFQTQYKRMDS